MSQIILEHLIERLRQAAIYNRHDLAPPTVVLWTDGEGLWSPVIPLIREAMPELLVLAAEVQGEGAGPSTWVRYQLARRPWAKPPVLYLPGVARQAFRGAAGFPETARHLFALQFQGQFWSQLNGKDWTPAAFLASDEGGLGLDLARDRATLEAVSDQLAQVLRATREALAGRRLEAPDFHGLAAGDPIGLLLEWMGGSAPGTPAPAWKAFSALAKSTFKLDPDKDGIITAVERLVAGGGVWDQVWQRWCQAPRAFPGVRKALDLAQPKDLFDAANDRFPATNRQREDDLRKALVGLAKVPKAQALERIRGLAAEHDSRAASVWADLGEAPLARAMVHLKALADGIATGGLGHDWATLAAAYLERGWAIDSAAWRAYAAVRDAPDLDAVTAALRAVYLPWLEALAEQVQGWDLHGYPGGTHGLLSPTAGTILVFVDGLRCDLGLELKRLLAGQGLDVRLDTRWSALPTVTATAKPAWRPLADGLVGTTLPDGFEPQVAETGKLLTSHSFRKLLAACGWAWLESGATGDPEGAAWTEVGTFDHDGHSQHARLAWRLEDELNAVAWRVRGLLQAGWRQAVLVTDHGWLWMPGGLPKLDLPGRLTESRWPRCAVAAPGAQHGFPEVPWFWGGGHAVVLAPGLGSFKAGVEYVHGGLSVQEALIPVLTVTAPEGAGEPVAILSADWKGLRLRVALQGAYAGTLLDIRTKAADAGTSLFPAGESLKAPGADGKVSLAVEADDLEGTSAVLVVLRDGQVVAKHPVTIGGD